jgi:hypothetical protein
MAKTKQWSVATWHYKACDAAKKLSASVDFDPMYRNVTKVKLLVALAKENAQVSPPLLFTEATASIC